MSKNKHTSPSEKVLTIAMGAAATIVTPAILLEGLALTLAKEASMCDRADINLSDVNPQKYGPATTQRLRQDILAKAREKHEQRANLASSAIERLLTQTLTR